MKNNKGITILEVIISVALISLVMVFLFRLLILVRNEDNLNMNRSNVNVILSLVLDEIHNDFNVKELNYVYKPTCVDLTSVPTNCCCSFGSKDCLKFFYKTGEVKELSISQTNSFNDTVKYGDLKRVLSANYSFLDYQNYNMTTDMKFEVEVFGEGAYESAPIETDYLVDSLMIIKIPIYRKSILQDNIEIREGYSFITNGPLLRTTCP